jgi:hypothetical protein
VGLDWLHSKERERTGVERVVLAPVEHQSRGGGVWGVWDGGREGRACVLQVPPWCLTAKTVPGLRYVCRAVKQQPGLLRTVVSRFLFATTVPWLRCVCALQGHQAAARRAGGVCGAGAPAHLIHAPG